MKHYVYRITNILVGRHYYGVRSSKFEPINDLGIKYFSSSTNKKFILEQKNHPEWFTYKIIMTFHTRELANMFEIKLHEKFNVSSNEKFYNRSENTSVGWVSYGKVSVVNEQGETFQVSLNDKRYIEGKLKSAATGKVNAIDRKTGNKKTVSVEEYHNNKNLICNNTGKVPIINNEGNSSLISKNEYNKGHLKHVSIGLVSACDTLTGTTKKVSKVEFDTNSDLVGVNTNRIFGHNNPNAKTILIFDKNDTLMFKCVGNFEEVCKENNLPFTSLKRTIYSKKRLYLTKKGKKDAINNKTIQFKGWYANIL